MLWPVKPCPVELSVASVHEPLGVRLREKGDLHRLRAGVYCSREAWGGLEPWDRYLARVHAWAMVSPDAVFAFESAAALLGLPIFGEPRDIHVFGIHARTSDRFGDVVVHTSTDMRDIDRAGGLQVTSPADTVLDLGRVLPPAFGIAVADSALRMGAGTVTVAGLEERGLSQRNGRGRARLRLIWEMADVRSESVGESVSRAVIEWCGFERPELQHWFEFEGHRDRTDFWWPSVRVAAESDGYGKYGTDPDAVRAALLDEKRREDRLRRQVRDFTRWDWPDTMRVVPVRSKLLSAGVPLVRPPRTDLLATLSRSARSRPR